MCELTRSDKIKNEVIWEKMRVTSVENNMRELRLRWFRYVHRRCAGAPMRRRERLVVEDSRRVDVGQRSIEKRVPLICSVLTKEVFN
ncbi:hypothetical protein H5410_004621 [Solanum commersonii]|uniref:Uncharacterized protein n=1 Tax=Solanum commersonii TaxID=4109 RepID=A0A9J6B865_SOLCO|nr:hypothetical protein H5410_004621 [Solanum commersonii]